MNELEEIYRTFSVRAPQSEAMTDVLWHYTDGAGLKGILETDRIYGTHFAYLNDTSEVVYAEDLVNACLERVRRTPKPDECTDNISWQLVCDWKLPSVSSWQIFVASFCRDGGDRLSQWRAYGRNGHGYSLGFRNMAPHFLMQPQMTTEILPIAYNSEESVRYAVGKLTWIAIEMSRLVATFPLQSEYIFLQAQQYLYFTMLTFALQQKHPGFSEEQECRLVAYVIGDHTDVQHRVTPRGRIPFLPLRLGFEHSLEEIVVGPNANMKADARSAVALLQSLGHADAERKVRLSSIPFRAQT